MNLAFYSCFYGSEKNSTFRIPVLPSTRYKCFFYTNNQVMMGNLEGTGWIGIFEDKPTTDDMYESNMLSKIVKTKPHTFPELRDFDYTCYLDSKVGHVSETFVENAIFKYFISGDSALLIRAHFEMIGSRTLWDEYFAAITQWRYMQMTDHLKKYIDRQADKGLVEEGPLLCATGFLIRNMKHPRMNEINETWYEHVEDCGINCQIAFYFVQQLFLPGVICPFSEVPYLKE